MLKIKENTFVILLVLILSFNSYAMDQNDKSCYYFENLPLELTQNIILQIPQIPLPQYIATHAVYAFFTSIVKNSITSSFFSKNEKISTLDHLEEIALTIRSLSQVNQTFHRLINDPQFCLKIIKAFPQKESTDGHYYFCSNECSARLLGTNEAQKRLKVQLKLRRLLDEETSFDNFTQKFSKFCEKYSADYIDFNFTYTQRNIYHVEPLLKYECRRSSEKEKKKEDFNKIKCLLDTKAIDMNCTNGYIEMSGCYGNTPLMHFMYYINSDEKDNIDLLKLLCNAPKIDINKQNYAGETALLKACSHHKGPEPAIIKTLLDAGADPEMVNNKGISPLQQINSALSNPDPRFTYDKINQASTLLQNAITKKYITATKN